MKITNNHEKFKKLNCKGFKIKIYEILGRQFLYFTHNFESTLDNGSTTKISKIEASRII